MSEKVEQQYSSELSQVYAQLKQRDVEQFYTGYQWWKIRERIIALQAEISTLRQQIDENAQYMQEVRPPAVALATLARLQANGVHDLELLDRMLERGEGWLDLIMQRLDYCEQLEFFPDNYTQWCEHALEGAYDWIDSMRVADALGSSAASSDIVDLVSVEATEELLLRKLTSEEEEEEAQPALKDATPALSSLVSAIEEVQPMTEEVLPTVEEFETIAEGSLPEETDVIASAFVEEDNAEILLPDEVVATEQETEISLLVETAASDDASLVTEEQYAALDSFLPQEIEAEINSTTAPIEQDSEPQAAEPAPILEGPPSFEGSVEADAAQVAIDQVASPEDTGVSATQETPLPGGADASAASDELHNEQVAETVPDVALPVETNAEIASPVEAAPEGVHTVEEGISQEAVPEAVHSADESISQEAVPEAVHSADEGSSQQDVESAAAQNVKPRGFWRRLLALFRG